MRSFFDEEAKKASEKTFVQDCEINKIKKHDCKSEMHYYKTIICFLFSLFQFCGTENVVYCLPWDETSKEIRAKINKLNILRVFIFWRGRNITVWFSVLKNLVVCFAFVFTWVQKGSLTLAYLCFLKGTEPNCFFVSIRRVVWYSRRRCSLLQISTAQSGCVSLLQFG